jgi:hypothetical protein
MNLPATMMVCSGLLLAAAAAEPSTAELPDQADQGDVRAQLDAGRPLVIDFKSIGDRYPGGAAGHTLLLAGYSAGENLCIFCNPAIATPGLHLMTASALDQNWRSDGYSDSSGGVLSRPAIVLEQP